MPEFLTLLPPLEALNHLLKNLEHPRPALEWVATAEALGRVTVRAVPAPEALPPFTRSSVDGYAVQAADTHGASDSLPVYLKIVGEVAMGAAPDFSLQAGQAAVIHTGGMLPEGADAVVMLETTQPARGDEVEVLKAVAAGENLLVAGEDVTPGQEVIPAGRRLRAAEIGGLMALGVLEVAVAKPPCIGILSSGDEVIPPHDTPKPGQVRDINSYSLSAVVLHSGGAPVRLGVVPDQPQALRRAAEEALATCDALVITAGSSASARDLTATVVDGLGKPGVLVHGVSVRPGKPTILAVCDGKPVIGLPGNPVSALVIAGLFVRPVIERLLGLDRPPFLAALQARLTINLASQAGREDWIPVQLFRSDEGYLAEPIFFKSNLIFSLVQADGLVRIPPEANGLALGETIEVVLLQ